MLEWPIRLIVGKMAARGGRGRSAPQASSSAKADADADLLLHPELLSQEFLLLTLEQKNVPVEDEVKSNKDGLAGLYVQHVIPLPQRNLPKSRWGKLMEEKRGQHVLKHDFKSVASVESLRKRPLIVFDGSSTSTSIKVRKTENGTIDSLKLLATGNNSSICRRLHVPSDCSTCISPSALSQDIKVESRINEAKQNNIVFNDITSNQKSPPLVSVTGATIVKLKRAAPKEESGATNGLQPTEAKKKIQRVTWP